LGVEDVGYSLDLAGRYSMKRFRRDVEGGVKERGERSSRATKKRGK